MTTRDLATSTSPAVARGRAQVPPSGDSVTATKRAVIYLRVSTAQQVNTGRDPEGFSIPAQREACVRKAESLSAAVVDEYADKGESARSADRAGLQRMLERLSTLRDIDYVIVHEICHFRHPHHGPAFLRMLGSLMPDWRAVKERLEQTEY